MRQHLAEVSPRIQNLLRHAAVLGREIDVERLRKLSGSSPEEVSEAIEEAGAAGLLGRGPNAELRFVHALVAESLHDSFDAGTKAALHALATEILERTRHGGDATSLGALAEHAWQAASRIGVTRAAAHCERAAQAAVRRYAFEEAARLYARALARGRAPGRRGELDPDA